MERVRVPRSEEMTEGGRDGVRNVGSPGRANSHHEFGHHRLDLLLLGPTVSGDRLLDRCRAVLKDPHSGRPQSREDDTTRVGQLERRSRADAVEWRFNRSVRRRMLEDDGRDPGMEACEPFRECHALGESDLSAGNQLGRIGSPGDDGPPGASGSRVDPQDPPGYRQDAA